MLSALIPAAHSYPAVLLAEQLVHQRCVHPGPLVLRTAPLKFPAPATDRDRTVSRRSEPSSRTALMGEQPNPWDLLQPQDAMSRHRGAKPPRRCERSGEISLLSPEYLLSVERRPFHPAPPDHLALSAARVHGTGLGLKHAKGGVSLAARRGPGAPTRSLPPTLRMTGLSPILSCSKGSRGLSV